MSIMAYNELMEYMNDNGGIGTKDNAKLLLIQIRLQDAEIAKLEQEADDLQSDIIELKDMVQRLDEH